MVKFLVIVLFAFLWPSGESHTYHMGQCPSIDPMSGFQMNRMLGIWYVIQQSSTSSTCMTYNLTRTERPDKFELIQTSQDRTLQPFNRQYRYTGEITVPDQSVPGKMTIKFPLNIAGSATVTIFATDYDTYAGIFTCQKVGLAHGQSATILSRERTLDKLYVDKLRSKLSNANIDPFDLSVINQSQCPRETESLKSINIDHDMVSAKSGDRVFRSAGDDLSGLDDLTVGVKNVVGKVKNGLYAVDNAKSQMVTRFREDYDTMTARTRETLDHFKNRFREDVDHVKTRLRQNVDYIADRTREDVKAMDTRLTEDLDSLGGLGRNHQQSSYQRSTAKPEEWSYDD